MNVVTMGMTVTEKALGSIQAATLDDVQPAAFLAAEKWGCLIPVDAKLIGKAVDALRCTKSFSPEQCKLVLGLSSGGIAKATRESAGAICCSLLICGLRTNMRSKESGALLHDIIDSAGVLHLDP